MIEILRKTTLELIFNAVLLFISSASAIAANISCAEVAIEKASKLIEYQYGELNGFFVEIDRTSVKNLKSVVNQADPTERLAVVEVWGGIYKGNYHTRIIFSTKGGNCLMVGQEVLEVDRF